MTTTAWWTFHYVAVFTDGRHICMTITAWGTLHYVAVFTDGRHICMTITAWGTLHYVAVFTDGRHIWPLQHGGLFIPRKTVLLNSPNPELWYSLPPAASTSSC